LTLADIEYVT